jgi:predicted transglutaminase-like cysteine proteinase
MTADAVFTQAKSLFVYESDQVCFGKPEYWAALPELERGLQATGKVEGDCDDFASWCVGQLRAQGIEARYVVCKVETGEWHCVCESDGLILDNRQPAVMHYFALPYTWYSVSGYQAGDPWHLIKNN